MDSNIVAYPSLTCEASAESIAIHSGIGLTTRNEVKIERSLS